MAEQLKEQKDISSTPGDNGQGASVKIVLTANNHLGRDISGQSRREERLQRLRDAFQQATDFAVAQGADLFIQAGDLFDTTTPDERDRTFVATCLARLKQAGIPVIALGGLHDTPAANSIVPAPQRSYAQLGALHYFSPLFPDDERDPLFLEIHGEGVGIAGIGWTTEAVAPQNLFTRADVERIARVPLPLPVLHTPIEGVDTAWPRFVGRQKIVPMKRDDIEQQNAFRVLLDGYPHTYSRTRIGKTEVVAPGSTQSDIRDMRHPAASQQNEQEAFIPGFVYLGLASDGLRWCNHIPVDALLIKQLTIALGDLWTQHVPAVPVASSDQNIPQPTELLLRRLEPLCNAETMVWLRLEGEVTRSHYHQLDLNNIRQYGEQHCFSLAIDDSAVTLLPDHIDSNDQLRTTDRSQQHGERFSLREEVIVLADRWIADAAPNEQEQKTLRYVKEDVVAAIDGVLKKARGRGAVDAS